MKARDKSFHEIEKAAHGDSPVTPSRVSECGLLSLEASITLTIFIFLMLFLYSFFVVFEARAEMAHITLSVADSLSKDGIETSRKMDSDTVAKLIASLSGTSANDKSFFTDNRVWDSDDSAIENQSGPGANGGGGSASSLFHEVIRKRCIAYLAGGDRAMADKVLKRLRIKGGVDGLDFSGSYVSDGKLYLKIRYAVEYEFNVFGNREIRFEHSVCSKLWK